MQHIQGTENPYQNPDYYPNTGKPNLEYQNPTYYPDLGNHHAPLALAPGLEQLDLEMLGQPSGDRAGVYSYVLHQQQPGLVGIVC